MALVYWIIMLFNECIVPCNIFVKPKSYLLNFRLIDSIITIGFLFLSSIISMEPTRMFSLSRDNTFKSVWELSEYSIFLLS